MSFRLVAVTFALTICGTFGAALLVMPMSLAPLGPLWAAAIILGAGLISGLSQCYIAEAFARHHGMGRANAFLMRLSTDYLGPKLASALRYVLFGYAVLLLFAYLVGVSEFLGRILSVTPELITCGLFIICARFAGSLAVTLPAALVSTAVALSMVVFIAAVAALQIDWATLQSQLTWTIPAGTLSPSMVDRLLGLAIYSFCGHLAIASTAQLVLPQDPSGKSLLIGVAAATVTLAVLLAIWSFVMTSAIPIDALIAETSSVMNPLALLVGEWIYIPAAFLVVLTLGYGTVIYASSTFMMAQELIGDWWRGRRNGGTSQNSLDQLSALSWRAQRVLKASMKARLLGRTNTSIDQLSTELGLSRRALRNAVDELAVRGMVSQDQSGRNISPRLNIQLSPVPTAPTTTPGQAADERPNPKPNRSDWINWDALLPLSPTFAMFAAALTVQVLDLSNFTQALGFIGALICPFLVGLLPVLLLRAGRGASERAGSGVSWFLSNGLFQSLIFLAVLSLPFINALYAWDALWMKAAGLLSGFGMLWFLWEAVRTGAFSPSAPKPHRRSSKPKPPGKTDMLL